MNYAELWLQIESVNSFHGWFVICKAVVRYTGLPDCKNRSTRFRISFSIWGTENRHPLCVYQNQSIRLINISPVQFRPHHKSFIHLHRTDQQTSATLYFFLFLFLSLSLSLFLSFFLSIQINSIKNCFIGMTVNYTIWPKLSIHVQKDKIIIII